MPRRADLRASGPAAQTGAGDVALFGAVPLAFADIPAAAATRIEIGPAHTAAAPHSSSALVHTGHETMATESVSDSSDLTHEVQARFAAMPVNPPAPAADASAVQATPPAGNHIATFVSSVIPHAMQQVAGDATIGPSSEPAPQPAAAAAAQPPIDDTLAMIRASAASLHNAIGALADRLEAARPGEEAQQQVDAILDHLGDVAAATQDIAPIMTTLTHSAQTTVDSALTDAADLAGTVTTTLAAATNSAGEVIEDARAAIDGAAGQTAGTAHDFVGEAAEGVSNAAAAADHIVDDSAAVGIGLADGVTAALNDVADISVGSIADTDGFGGIDPAGGVATLVGMVHAADAFDLGDTPIAHDLAPALGAVGATDLLAEVAPADALLGVADHDNGLIAGATDHLADGLFGHG